MSNFKISICQLNGEHVISVSHDDGTQIKLAPQSTEQIQELTEQLIDYVAEVEHNNKTIHYYNGDPFDLDEPYLCGHESGINKDNGNSTGWDQVNCQGCLDHWKCPRDTDGDGDCAFCVGNPTACRKPKYKI